MISAARFFTNLMTDFADALHIPRTSEQATRVAHSAQFCLSEMPPEIRARIWSYVEPRDIADKVNRLSRSLRPSPIDRLYIIGQQIEGRGGRVTANELAEYWQLVRQDDLLEKITEFDLNKTDTSEETVGLSKSLLPRCKNIKKLSLSQDGSLNDRELQKIIRSLSQLQELDLSYCGSITDEGLRAIAPALTNLQSLNLRSCHITDEGLRAIARFLTNLQSLNLSWCHNITDGGLLAIAPALTNLQSLDLSGWNITDDGLRAIAPALTNLQSLILSWCGNITDEGLREIAPLLTHLQSLTLSWCRNITDEGFERSHLL